MKLNIKRNNKRKDAIATFGVKGMGEVSIKGAPDFVNEVLAVAFPIAIAKHTAAQRAAGKSDDEIREEWEAELNRACREAGLPEIQVPA